MSGLAGILNLDGAPVDTARLARMTLHMAFRGPDAQATWAEGAAGLGHALLRTTREAARERQPLSLDGTVWITASARIDGRAALLAGLRASGRSVETAAPDAELILHAYHAWGEACLERLIGDFAFAIWDAHQRRLMCARDQFGVAPLYYARAGEWLLISNTLNALRLHPGVPETLNEQAFGDFLLFGMNLDPATTSFTGIQRLPPAHRLTWADGRLRVERYWSPPEGGIVYRRPDDTVAEFSALFEQAVADRLRTEHVGTQLSGGMDTTSVALTAARLRDRDGLPVEVRACTVAYRNLIHDEEEQFARLVADQARLPLEVIVADEDTSSTRLIEPDSLSPEPGSLPASLDYRRLGERMARFSRVLLTGYGGDPLLYPSHTYLIGLATKLRWARLAERLRLAWQMQGDLPPFYARTRLKARLGRAPRPPLPGWLRQSFAESQGLEERWQQRHDRSRTVDNRRSMANDVYWSNLFANMDSGATHLPLELRYPFFDTRLLGFALTTPPVPWFTNKLLLREAMRAIMPEPVRQRPKTPLSGFPLQVLARQPEQQQWMLELAKAPELEPYVDRRRLLAMISSPARSGGMEYTGIVQPLALAYWLKRQSRPQQ